jgi:alpha-beta hydrolase superfamily lysophospholipase
VVIQAAQVKQYPLSELFDFEAFNLPDDYEGKVIATLIKSVKNRSRQPAVLYLHGFFDYFFHSHLAELFHQNNFNFYALDLRKCGCSLLSHQHSNYCKDITEYFGEIDIAIETVRKSNNSKIILLGHSLGGLICSVYLNYGRKRDCITALVLNSPFFDFNEPSLIKAGAPFLGKIISKISPFARIRDYSLPVYAKSLHKDYYGEWDFNPDWKPLEEGYPVYFSWLNAVGKGFTLIKRHSKILVPVLVLHSSSSAKYKVWNQKLLEVDGVLNIKDIERISHGLGDDVTIISISQGMHDVFLSRKEVRIDAFRQMIGWLNQKLRSSHF